MLLGKPEGNKIILYPVSDEIGRGTLKCGIPRVPEFFNLEPVVKIPIVLVAKKSKSLPIEVNLDKLAKRRKISSLFRMEDLIDYILDDELLSEEWMKVPASCIKKYNLHKKYDYYIKVIEL